MFRFEHTYNLYFLIGLVPLAALLYLGWFLYQRQAKQIGDSNLISQLTAGVSDLRRKWRAILTILLFALLVIAWANPQWGAKREKVKTRSSDIFIALDISTSMYCEDIAPNRLEQARKFAIQLTEKLRGERIGLILFAGNAYLQMPLTTDYAAAQIFLKSASPAQATSQGTAIGDAIRVAKEGFRRDQKFHKTLIIISDGEDHDADAIEMAKAATDEGMSIFTIGVGTAQGSFIPISIRGSQDWKRDETGQPVRTSLNETLMQAIADDGGGVYYYLNGTERILEDIDARVDKLEKESFEERSFTEYESYYQIFLGLAVFVFLIQWSLGYNLWSLKRPII